jgi:hypothetical protein
LFLQISSGSSITSMPHDRSSNRCGSRSDRALRPWPEAAVLLIVFVAARSILCAGQQLKAARHVFPSLASRDLLRYQGRRVSWRCEKHFLVDYDVARSLSLPSVRGHAGRDSPAGATCPFAACKRPRSACAKSSSADASASRVDAACSVCPDPIGADAINTGTSAVGRDAIDACTDAFTANKRWWNTIASN